MLEADYGATELAFAQENRGPGPGDEKLVVMFHLHPHPDPEASAKEGRPMFKEKTYVTIMVPGDKNNIVRRPAWDRDFERFPQQYTRFKNNESQQQHGTPIETVAWLTRAQCEELKFFNVRTLENLANIPDHTAGKFMGINKLRQKARDAIERAKQDAPAAALQEAVRVRDERIGQLDAQVKTLATQIEALAANQAKSK